MIPNDQGKVYMYVFTDPSAGDNFTGTIPDNRRWKLLGFRIQLTNDSNTADRYLTMSIRDGTGNMSIWICITVGPLTADNSLEYYFAPNITQDVSSDAITNASVRVSIPELLLKSGDQIICNVFNRQAGDQLDLISAYVEEWIQPQ